MNPADELRAAAHLMRNPVHITTGATLPDLRDALTRAETAEAAIARARAHHQPTEGLGHGPDGYGDIPQACTSCGTSDELAIPWPCDTVLALDGPPEPTT